MRDAHPGRTPTTAPDSSASAATGAPAAPEPGRRRARVRRAPRQSGGTFQLGAAPRPRPGPRRTTTLDRPGHVPTRTATRHHQRRSPPSTTATRWAQRKGQPSLDHVPYDVRERDVKSDGAIGTHAGTYPCYLRVSRQTFRDWDGLFVCWLRSSARDSSGRHDHLTELRAGLNQVAAAAARQDLAACWPSVAACQLPTGSVQRSRRLAPS